MHQVAMGPGAPDEPGRPLNGGDTPPTKELDMKLRNGSDQQHQFSQVPHANIARSTFSRSHGFKTTFNSALLVPFYVDEVLPGDTYAVNATLFARLSTPFVPVMDNIYLDTFYFFVPHRLVWTHFANFMGEENAPGDYVNNVVSYLTPVVTTPAGGHTALSLADYFGIPTSINGMQNVIAFPFRAYNLIWNEWFRDENVSFKLPVNTGDGPDAATDYNLVQRMKRHDYFTSCLPWPQKGPGVSIPLGAQATVKTNATDLLTGVQPNMRLLTAAAGATPTAQRAVGTGAVGNNFGESATAITPGAGLYPSNLYADLSTATAATINSLRQAFQIQRLYERDARGGSRYTELVRSHFGVTSPDARLQRPEYLGGSTQRVNISPVTQTSASNTQPTPLASLAGIGTSAGQTGFTKSFTEHGTIIGLMSVRADMTYQQGLNKMWSRRTRFDFYWPVLANLGEQPVLNQEIYAQGTAADLQAFGYQERWAEYRYYPSLITGQFRSQHPLPLDVWHLAQKFTALPTLNTAFMVEAPPISRILAVPSQPQFLLDSYIDVRATRPMPVYSVPGMIDHF
ncbi:MAG: major capsid protein [Microvirus sp.]|nr:MAG: major capsid protein [Microvirus sp.]